MAHHDRVLTLDLSGTWEIEDARVKLKEAAR
jgi:hypothetical protein